MGGKYKKMGLGFRDKKDFERYILLKSTRGSAVERSSRMQGNIIGVKRPFISSLPFLLVH